MLIQRIAKCGPLTWLRMGGCHVSNLPAGQRAKSSRGGETQRGAGLWWDATPEESNVFTMQNTAHKPLCQHSWLCCTNQREGKMEMQRQPELHKIQPLSLTHTFNQLAGQTKATNKGNQSKAD